jgi:hypothetical protein
MAATITIKNGLKSVSVEFDTMHNFGGEYQEELELIRALALGLWNEIGE